MLGETDLLSLPWSSVLWPVPSMESYARLGIVGPLGTPTNGLLLRARSALFRTRSEVSIAPTCLDARHHSEVYISLRVRSREREL
jgi:hypothetical protein